MTKNFNDLRLNKSYSDVTIIAGEKEFPANKSVLSVRSPVFERMFSENFREHEENIVRITDIDADIMEALLDFIYTAEVANLKELAPDLLLAADKYGMSSLYTVCVNNIIENLSLDNVVQMFILADTYKIDRLKEKTMTFINSNGQKVFATEDWKKLVKPNQALMIELYENMIENHHCSTSPNIVNYVLGVMDDYDYDLDD